MTATPIETRYAGHRFRSRLEARWAVFFDTMQIPWCYEPEGFTLTGGRNYLPDFLLPECGTWIEVKGGAHQLDTTLMKLAAHELPRIPPKAESGPKLMILGPIPEPQDPDHDYGWYSLDSHLWLRVDMFRVRRISQEFTPLVAALRRRTHRPTHPLPCTRGGQFTRRLRRSQISPL